MHDITVINDGFVCVGCHRKHISEWLETFQQVGEDADYSAAQIAEYKKYLDLVQIYIDRSLEGGPK